MATQNIETVTSKGDLALVTLAVLAAAAGVLGFTFLTDQAMLTRVGVLIGGLVLAVVIAYFSPSGKRFLAYARESYEDSAWAAASRRRGPCSVSSPTIPMGGTTSCRPSTICSRSTTTSAGR